MKKRRYREVKQLVQDLTAIKGRTGDSALEYHWRPPEPLLCATCELPKREGEEGELGGDSGRRMD